MDTLFRLDEALETLNTRIIKGLAVKERLKTTEEEYYKLVEEELILEGASSLLSTFSEEEQEKVINKIEGIISYALQIIFPTVFKGFKLSLGTERGRVTLKPTLVFLCDGIEVSSGILGSHGGGPSDVIGFLLKLLILVLQYPKHRSILFLDESFAHLSAEYLPMMGEVISKMVTDLGKDLQVILVTHQQEFIEFSDTAYRFKKSKDYTEVERIK